jgi:hypothetical protein
MASGEAALSGEVIVIALSVALGPPLESSQGEFLWPLTLFLLFR